MREQGKKVDQLTFDFGTVFDNSVPSGTESSPVEEWDEVTEEFDFSDDPETESEMAETIREDMEAVSASSLEMNPKRKGVISKEEVTSEIVESAAVSAAVPVTEKDSPEKELKKLDLKRAALAFLASLGASAIAKDVPTRGSRFRADAAAFFLDEGNQSKKNGSLRTALAEVRTASEAQIECANHTQHLTMLRAARLERESLEQEIRRTEPYLRDDSTLFIEFEHWNYSASKNAAYKECMQRIRDLEYAIFHGSRLSKFHTAGIASELYLVVPEGSVCMESVAENWGLVFVKKDLSFELVKKPLHYDCPAENLLRMVRNIASSACKEVLFANGIREKKDSVDGAVYKVGSLPRKRRK